MALRHVADCPCLPLCVISWEYLKRRPSYCDFPFLTWWLADILDFVVTQKWHQGILQAVHGHQHAKFSEDTSNSSWVMEIILFQNGVRPPSWILLDFVFRPPTKSTWWAEAIFKILFLSNLYFRIYCNFQKFGLKCLFGRKKCFFFGISPLNISGYHRDSQKALPCVEPRILTYRSSKLVNRGDLQARRRNEKRKESHKQWYFTHAPRPPT